ncbi:hypothetical protein COX00_00650 [Candidatus Uhrbacteria bacterium CG22_combo_CG10-13_8_21_14_all_47_17]|uniref:PDZ domain-containing protein n=1 Tax=Candidatus Uhrbacteria bacterium CG22_combo_CG10-13_8_21_14_all_47_17 TaxID=1975041 RepID=A0A2H0BV21_9BACT|nr:MAG: hypothetical protein COX00_00650 [Candidatus Uhrbacteria bacterium CG22_combo_CG10-13_8_21_14_all_47_17]
MAKKREPSFHILNSPIFWAAVFSVLVSTGVSWLFAQYRLEPQIEQLAQLILSSNTTEAPPAQPSQPSVEIVPLETRPLETAYPAAFSERRVSPLLQLVRLSPKTVAGVPLTEDHILGDVVALTSDGWVATTQTVMKDYRLADLGVLWNGEVKPLTLGYRDKSTGLAYLKTEATGLSITNFVRAADVVTGSAVWMESAPSVLHPESIIRLRSPQVATVLSSEVASRRFLVSGASTEASPGSAIWDGAGRLIGVVEDYSDKDAGWRIIPAGMMSSDLANLLSTNQIQRASLGVRAIDLSQVTFADRANLPVRGAWLEPDRVKGLPAVDKKGPSIDLLQEGDVIERIERDILDGNADLGEHLLEYRSGASVTVAGTRAGKPFETKVTLGSVVTTESIK